jgi:hypothetical protein
MKLRLLALLALGLTVAPLDAGIFGRKKKEDPSPAQRVPELLQIIQTDRDDHNRLRAIEELRNYSPTDYPQIVPTLLHALMSDPKASVRAEAVQTLGRYRPVAPQIGQALEYARENDDSMRVRLQARSSLLQYHWNGYKSGGKMDKPTVQTDEPPLAPPIGPAVTPPRAHTPVINPTGTREVIFPPQPRNSTPNFPLPPVTSPVNQPNLQPVPIPVLEAAPGFRPLPPGNEAPAGTQADGPVLQPPGR